MSDPSPLPSPAIGEEGDRTARHARLPLGLIGTLAIVAAVESSIASHPETFTESAAWAWRLSGEAARREAKGAGVLCFGDSLSKHGLLPSVLWERLGTRAYNLATPSATAPAHYYLLRHALGAGARPRAVVVDFMPGMLAGTPDYAARNWPELLTTADLLDLARSWGRAGFFIETAVAKLLASVRARWEIRGHLAAALAGRADPLGETNRMLRRNWSIHLGAQFTQDNPAWLGEPGEKDHALHGSRAFWCHAVNRLYVERFFALAASRGIRAYWLIPPATPRIREARKASGVEERYTRFVREVLARHPEVVVLDARRAGYDHTRFVDPVHLTGKGALCLSHDVARAIAGGESGWVDLPRYRDVDPGRPFEDLEQSRIAVRSAAARR